VITPCHPASAEFPLQHVDDLTDQLTETWRRRGDVFMPMYQTEAMWLYFYGSYPCAIKIGAGKINAVTGEDWRNALTEKPEDYVVVPGQPWLDGFCVYKGL